MKLGLEWMLPKLEYLDLSQHLMDHLILALKLELDKKMLMDHTQHLHQSHGLVPGMMLVEELKEKPLSDPIIVFGLEETGIASLYLVLMH